MPFTAKRVDEREYFGFRYRALLPDAVVITSAVWSITVLEGTDADAADMISGSPIIADDLVSQLIIDGVAGVKYCLECLATFSDGQKVALCDTVWVLGPCVD